VHLLYAGGGVSTSQAIGLRAYSTRKPSVGGLTHVGSSGDAHMVDISDKKATHRTAVARGTLTFTNAQIPEWIQANATKKGDVLATARIAGIMGAKRTSSLVPLCHNIRLTAVSVHLEVLPDSIEMECVVECVEKTGVEMEALTGVMTCGLTLYDMLKAVDKRMRIENVRVVKKIGGKSGDWREE